MPFSRPTPPRGSNRAQTSQELSRSIHICGLSIRKYSFTEISILFVSTVTCNDVWLAGYGHAVDMGENQARACDAHPLLMLQVETLYSPVLYRIVYTVMRSLNQPTKKAPVPRP